MGTKLLPVPYHRQNEQYYCGAAVAQMVIEFRDNVVLDQDDIDQKIQQGNRKSNRADVDANWAADPSGLKSALNNLFNNGKRYRQRAYQNPDSLADRLIETIEDAGESPLVLLSGEHWVVVQGCQTEADQILAFFLHDPLPYFESYPYTTPHATNDGCSAEGQPEIHVSYQEWLSWISPVDEEGSWKGKYVGLCVDP